MTRLQEEERNPAQRNAGAPVDCLWGGCGSQAPSPAGRSAGRPAALILPPGSRAAAPMPGKETACPTRQSPGAAGGTQRRCPGLPRVPRWHPPMSWSRGRGLLGGRIPRAEQARKHAHLDMSTGRVVECTAGPLPAVVLGLGVLLGRLGCCGFSVASEVDGRATELLRTAEEEEGGRPGPEESQRCRERPPAPVVLDLAR